MKKYRNLNQETAERLRAMDLSPRAIVAVETTPINFMYEVFGGLKTVEQVEEFVMEMLEDDED